MNCDKKYHEKCENINQCEINTINRELIKAAEKGDTEKVKELLSIGANPNFQDIYGCTALICASSKGHLDVVNRLLNCKEIKVNAQTKNGMTALMIASHHGHLDVVNILIKYKDIINVNFQNRFENALEAASRGGHLNIVNRLLECTEKNGYSFPIDVNLRGKDGQTALSTPAFKGYIDVVNRLLEYKADVNSPGSLGLGMSILMFSVINLQNINITYRLLECTEENGYPFPLMLI